MFIIYCRLMNLAWTCPIYYLGALAIAVISKYYKIPYFNWAATGVEMTDFERFPTVARVIGSALKYKICPILFFYFISIDYFLESDVLLKNCCFISTGEGLLCSILMTAIFGSATQSVKGYEKFCSEEE